MMQNNEHKLWNSVRRLVKEKGYYIVLSLCIAAVGISGYVFLSTAIRQNRQEEQTTMSVPLTVTEPEEEEKEPVRPSETEDPEAPSAQTSAQTPPAEPAVEEPEPVVMPVSGEVSREHAMDRLVYNATTRDWRVHNGVDLQAEAGTPVAAAMAGTVTAVYEDELYGTTVVIRHADGYSTHYSSLAQDPAVAAGDTVTAGQTVGHVADTALLEVSDGPHLHLEVYQSGAPVDPTEFLP